MKVAIDLEDEDLMLSCDRQLMVMLLTQYIDNACKYSHLRHHDHHSRSCMKRRKSFFPCTVSGR
jgi:K+-sensing histidine kinase KdpD